METVQMPETKKVDKSTDSTESKLTEIEITQLITNPLPNNVSDKQKQTATETTLTIADENPPPDYWTSRPPYNPSPEWREKFIRRASCGSVDTKNTSSKSYQTLHYLSGVNWRRKFVGASVPALMWTFFLSLKVLSTGFKLVGGKDSAKMFDVAENPFSGVMLGILATVLVQSSSTSTSLIVTAVAAGELSVENAIAMVMGANIGTTITNTLVSFFHIKDRKDFRRAISSATVHDLFNFLTVATLLPIEWGTNFLVNITDAMTTDVKACEGDCKAWKNPISLSISPVAKGWASYDKKILKAIAEGSCNDANSTVSCDKPLLKAGLLHEAGFSDNAAGLISIFGSIAVLCFCLYAVVKSLHYLIRGNMARLLKKSLDYNDYLTMLIGCGITILVQSSSITTATLTPLCAEGLISLEQMFPLTLGANVGTTITGLLAASVATKHAKEALQTALAHVLFNVIGIAIWYPAPCMRKLPLNGARLIGKISEQKRWFPAAYTLIAFVGIPAAGWAISNALTPDKSATTTDPLSEFSNMTNATSTHHKEMGRLLNRLWVDPHETHTVTASTANFNYG